PTTSPTHPCCTLHSRADHLDLHSFPTRRSSDLVDEGGAGGERSQAETSRVEGHSVDRRGRFASFVEHQLERVTIQQVDAVEGRIDRKSTRLNSSHVSISYAVFCLKKKTFS